MPDGKLKRMIISQFSGKPYDPSESFVPPPPTENQNYTSYAELAGRRGQQTPLSGTPVQETPPPQNVPPRQTYTSYADLRNHQYQRQQIQANDTPSDNVAYQVRGHI